MCMCIYVYVYIYVHTYTLTLTHDCKSQYRNRCTYSHEMVVDSAPSGRLQHPISIGPKINNIPQSVGLSDPPENIGVVSCRTDLSRMRGAGAAKRAYQGTWHRPTPVRPKGFLPSEQHIAKSL